MDLCKKDFDCGEVLLSFMLTQYLEVIVHFSETYHVWFYMLLLD